LFKAVQEVDKNVDLAERLFLFNSVLEVLGLVLKMTISSIRIDLEIRLIYAANANNVSLKRAVIGNRSKN